MTAQKPSCIILSDMFGLKTDSSYDDSYLFETEKFLNQIGFETKVHSSLQLGKIGGKEQSSENIHNAFILQGINTAVNSLLQQEDNYTIGIGFSIGGTILWKASQIKKSLIKKIICFSSTRLRNEIKKSPHPAIAVYGENDQFAPDQFHIKSLGCEYLLIPSVGHDFYKTNDLTKILKRVI